MPNAAPIATIRHHLRLARGPLLLVMLCVCAILLTPDRASAEQLIVVLVNDEPISAYDVSQRMRFLAMTAGKKSSSALRKQTIEELIAERLKLQEAKKLGVTLSEERITAVLEDISKRNKMTVDKLIAGLKQSGVDVRTFRERIKSSLIWRSVVQRKFRRQVSVSASEVDEVLSSSEAGGKESTEFQLQRVRLEFGEDADQKTIAERLVEAESLRSRFRSCDKIEDVVKGVRRTSIKSIRPKRTDQLDQPSRALVMKAKAGEMTPPYITATGVELYAVCSRRSVRTNTKARRAIERKMEDEEFERLASRYLQDLRRDAYIEHRGKT